MQHYQDVILDRSGNVVIGAQITVTNHLTGAVQATYSDVDGLSPNNVILTNTLGTFSFYIATGRYDIAVKKNGTTIASYIDLFINVYSQTSSINDPIFTGLLTADNIALTNSLAAQDITARGGITCSSLNGGQLAGLRNRIINGSAMIAQRGSVALTASALYASDRVLMSVLGGTGITATGSSSVLGGTASGFGHFITASFTNGQPLFAQRIESANCFDLNSKTITVSGKFFQNTGASQIIQVRISKPTTTKDTFSAVTILQTSAAITIPNGTGTPTAFSATFTLGATDASLGLIVEVYIAAIITQSVAALFAISDWQLEIGSVVTPFEQRPYGMELALCQRYYVSSRFFISGVVAYVALPTPMRINLSSAVITGGGAGFALADANTATGMICFQTGASGQTMAISVEL
jgi:hypothetical protein